MLLDLKPHVKKQYVAPHAPKMYLHTKLGFLPKNEINVCSGLDLSRTEDRGQGHSELETVVDTLWPNDVSTYQIWEFYLIKYRRYALSRSKSQ